MIAVVCAVIGAVTTISLRSYLNRQLDAQVAAVAQRAAGPLKGASLPAGPAPGTLGSTDNSGSGDNTGSTDSSISGGELSYLATPGLNPGVIGAHLDADHQVTSAGIAVQSTPGASMQVQQFSAAQQAVFASVPLDTGMHTVTVPGYGDYRVTLVHTPGTSTGYTVIGLSTTDVDDTISTYMTIEALVAAAGLVAAGLAGSVLIRYSLRPLRRVASTATRVSELRLDKGEVALHDRVPDADTDNRTEVGQVGAALNRMLGHVAEALNARQESETRVRQFVADASHELRTPLASIRGYAELTRRGREQIGPDTRHALGRIESEAARMTTLVEDLLLLARLDAGRPLALAETDMSPLVVDAVSDARAVGRDHRWYLELPDDPACVHGDPQRLHQVLTNLLANARTHTPPGTTVVARVVPDDFEVVVEIADNGPGIPPDLLPHVFERFARGDASRSRAAGTVGSTGLGLAIVQAVVTAHGGRITLNSMPGYTAFRVHLPVTHSQLTLSLATMS
jgi:two-component system OmpR family sensor kinase